MLWKQLPNKRLMQRQKVSAWKQHTLYYNTTYIINLCCMRDSVTHIIQRSMNYALKMSVSSGDWHRLL